MPPSIDESIVIVREDERGFAAAAHFPLGAIPLWGVVFIAMLWIYFKERSREVVFHLQQIFFFQLVQLGAWFVWLAIGLVLKPVRLINEGVADFLSQANFFFLAVFLAAYAAICVYGAALVFLGRPFLYPIVGRRVLEGALGKYAAED